MPSVAAEPESSSTTLQSGGRADERMFVWNEVASRSVLMLATADGLLVSLQINESVGQIAAQSDDLAATVKGNIRDAAGVASQEVRGRN